MRAVETNSQWALKSPKDGIVQSTVSARNLWIRLLTARVETGEPYIIFVDTVNRLIPQHHKLAGLNVKTSNLCYQNGGGYEIHSNIEQYDSYSISQHLRLGINISIL